ncbi:hypothetical protein Hdeb2414_s0026g00684461 [Helianthus debilis subsp. tardiflorus]
MATAFSCNFNKIWPPDLVKSTGVEERSLTAHRISEDPSRFRVISHLRVENLKADDHNHKDDGYGQVALQENIASGHVTVYALLQHQTCWSLFYL